MSIEILLDLIRHKFSPSEGQILVKSLHQDPLVWQFFKDSEKSSPYLDLVSDGIRSFQPGKIATWLIESKENVSLQILDDETVALPDPIKQEAMRAYETIMNSGLPPADLLTASLVALHIREKRVEQGNWLGLLVEILNKPHKNADIKNYLIWRTPFACLYHFCPDFEDLTLDFLKKKSTTPLPSGMPVFIHALLANPMDLDALLNRLYVLANNGPIDWQLEVLKWLEAFGRSGLREKLAKILIQSKSNVDAFAKLFSELESLENKDGEVDPLVKQIRYTLPEDVNRLAAFYYYCGNTEKSAETYQRSVDLLEYIQAQTSFQSIISHPNRATDLNWMNIIKSVPNSRKARHFFIQSLIKAEKISEAKQHLEELTPSPEKELLQIQADLLNKERSKSDLKMLGALKPNSKEKLPSETDYFVGNSSLAIQKEIIKTCDQLEDFQDCLPIIDKILDDNMHDLEFITAARNLYERGGSSSKSIEIASYLERLEPDNSQHKRTLSRLYSQVERWQEAFSTLQDLVKSDPSPEPGDLERFAKAALRTDRIDMAISVCQNILKHDGKNTKALVLLGESYMAKGDSVKAIQHMEQVVEMLPKEAITWLTLAKLWEKSGHPDRAYEILKKGVFELPNNAELLRSLGSACIEKQAPSDALAYLRKANEIDPNNVTGNFYLAHAEYLLGQNDQALGHLEYFTKNYADNPKEARLLGQVLLALDRNEEAEPVLLAAATFDPNDKETIIAASRLIIDRIDAPVDERTEEQLKSLDSLQAILHKAKSINPEEDAFKLHLADIDRLKGATEKAFSSYTKLSKEGNPETTLKNWRLHYGLGKSATVLGNLEVGLAALQEAASRQSENLLIHHALAETYQKSDLNGKAQETAKAALKLAPQDLDNILWYANFKTNNNEPQQAVKAIQEALQINPDRPELKLYLAKAQLSAGNNEESHKTIYDLIENSSPGAEILHRASYTCVQLNDLKLAADALESANRQHQEIDPMIIMDLAEVYVRQNQLKKALESLQCHPSTIKEFPQIGLLKAEVLINLGQYEAAYVTLKTIEETSQEDLVKKLEKQNPKDQSPLLYTYDFTNQGFLFQLGQVALAIGKFEESHLNLSKAIEIAPANIKIRNAVCQSFLLTVDLEKALKYVENNELFQDNLHNKGNDWLNLLCSKAEILLLQGKFEEADDFLNQTSTSNLIFSRLIAIRSRIAAHLGKYDQSETYLNQSIEKYQQNIEVLDSLSLETTLQKFLTLTAIAEAAQAQDDFPLASKYHQYAWDTLPDQPLQNMRFAKTLIKGAELQGMAETLSIENHSPGKEFLSEHNQQLFQALVDALPAGFCQEKTMCMKARGKAAFRGKWPLSLNAESCLSGTDEAAAILLSSEDDQLINNILDAYGDNIHVLQAYGVHLLRCNKKDGQNWVEKALTIDTSNPINHALLAMVSIDEPELAIQALETALEFWPNEPAWHAFAADLYAKLGNTFAASRHIDIALDAKPDDAKFWQKSAEIKIQQNELRRAKQDLEKSASYQSENPGVYLKMADINRRMGSVNEAIQNIRKASLLDPKNSDIAMEELQYLFETKNYREAEAKAKEILDVNRKNEDVRIIFAHAKAKQGKFNDALEVLKSALESEPSNISFKLESLRIRKDQEGIQAVIPELISMAQDHPDETDVLTTLTDWLIKTNQLDKAKETAQKILKIKPKQANVHLMLGRLQRKIGQLDQAISHLIDAINFDPNLVEAYIELGKTYQDRRDLEQAIESFQMGSKVNASDPRPYYFAGMAMKECKDYKNAEMMLKQAKKFSPDDANIVRQLGVITALNLINNLRETR